MNEKIMLKRFKTVPDYASLVVAVGYIYRSIEVLRCIRSKKLKAAFSNGLYCFGSTLESTIEKAYATSNSYSLVQLGYYWLNVNETNAIRKKCCGKIRIKQFTALLRCLYIHRTLSSFLIRAKTSEYIASCFRIVEKAVQRID